MSGIKVVFGAAVVGKKPFESHEEISQLLDTLHKCHIDTLDTAQLYGDSEALLGGVDAAKRFIIDTKEKGGFDNEEGPTGSRVETRGNESLEKLKTDKVDIFYIHAPHAKVPLSDTLAGIDSLHKAGKFSRFGLSNFKPADVQRVYDHCKEKNYVLPSVYQGNYSPVARKQEQDLFPLLRRLGMSFYAYSPLAGGFLTKTKEQIKEGAGRYKNDNVLGQMYLALYNKPSYLNALQSWEEVAKEEHAGKAELAYRWVVFNSPLKKGNGDAIIIGASRLEQVTNTAEFLKKGPLSQKAVEAIEEIWKSVEPDAPLDNWHDFGQAILET